MARFLFWSDLHCEFSSFDVPFPAGTPGALDAAPAREDIDAVLIAGDTDLKGRHIDFALRVWDIWRVPVLMVDGNHEGYGFKNLQKLWLHEDTRIAEARDAGADIQILRGDSRVIGDTRVIGATLWTDTLLWPEFADDARFRVEATMQEYKNVRWNDTSRGIYRKLRVWDTLEMHRNEKASILRALAEPFDGRTLVMTHHVPVMQMMAAQHLAAREPISAAYFSDLWDEISAYPVDGWLCGHSHESVEVVMHGAHGETAFFKNARGYPSEVNDFDPLRIVDSNDLTRSLRAAPFISADSDAAEP